MGNLQDVNASNWETEVLQSDTPVIVDFWATWCMPCKAMAPLLEQVQTENDGAVKIVKLDIQKDMPIASRYGVKNIPTLLVYKNGEVVDRRMGNTGGISALRTFVGRHL